MLPLVPLKDTAGEKGEPGALGGGVGGALAQKNLSKYHAVWRISNHNSSHYDMFILQCRCYKKLPNDAIYKKNTRNSQTVLIRLCTNETCPRLFPLPNSMWGTGNT